MGSTARARLAPGHGDPPAGAEPAACSLLSAHGRGAVAPGLCANPSHARLKHTPVDSSLLPAAVLTNFQPGLRGAAGYGDSSPPIWPGLRGPGRAERPLPRGKGAGHPQLPALSKAESDPPIFKKTSQEMGTRPACAVRPRHARRGLRPPLTCDRVCVQPAPKGEHVQLVQPGDLLQELPAVRAQAGVQHRLASAQLEVEDPLHRRAPVSGPPGWHGHCRQNQGLPARADLRGPNAPRACALRPDSALSAATTHSTPAPASDNQGPRL